MAIRQFSLGCLWNAFPLAARAGGGQEPRLNETKLWEKGGRYRRSNVVNVCDVSETGVSKWVGSFWRVLLVRNRWHDWSLVVAHTANLYTYTRRCSPVCCAIHTVYTRRWSGRESCTSACMSGGLWVDGVGFCSPGSRWTKKDSGGDDEERLTGRVWGGGGGKCYSEI